MTLLSSCALCYLRALTLLLVSLPMAFAECPRIVSRDEWGAQTPSSKTPQQVPVPFVVIHHGGIAEYCDNETTCGEQARAYQSLHMDKRGWDDIGYSFLVGEDGNVYEGRGWRRVGAHAPQYNNQSIGVCIIGDFSERLPNRKALEAVERLINCGLEEGLIVPNYTILGHRQTRDTLCPGEVLYKEITSWPHWDPNPSPRKYHPQQGQGSTFALSSLALLTAFASLLL